ncbi:XRE family transcriptional regulator [Escherichia coli]|nr:XRE family transcriptional regulator [Escherichia coli]EGK3862950.1 XRE family transcriptional regulator [Escherichia coli]EHE8152588.1 XRE family transcriptional regulator [Salmonella enterica subsp. enterica serovar Agona]MBB9476353.1 XRE family transcriptional regulator [Escherichia coli]MBC0235799.1 XRE family transcriptional regulator [Escherichia coli]
MTRLRYTLGELLAEAEASGQYPLPPEQREWVDAPALGREWPACEALEADQVRARLHDDAMAEAFRKDPAYAVELLHSILEDGDQGELLIALRQMTKAADREMLTPFDPAEWLTSAEAVVAFLADAEATADPTYIEHAHEVAARAKAMHGIE